MRNYLLVLGFGVLGAMGVIVTPAALAEGEPISKVQPQQVIRDITSLSEVEQPLTTAEGLLVQQPAPTPAPAQVTGVQLKPTEKGLEVLLETAAEFPEVLNSETENSLITDIPNAQLRLPKGGAFRQDNPTQDIASVEVINLDPKTLRVTVTGKAGVPTAEVSQSPQALILSVVAPPAPAQPTPAPAVPPLTPASPAEPPQPAALEAEPQPKPQAEEKPVDLFLTAEEEAGNYNVPDATTATKTDTPLRDIPQSIQVVPQQVLKDQNITRIEDATRNVSSVTQNKGNGGINDDYIIRGFFTGEELRNGFKTIDAYENPANIERVEVLKGPASVLYGQFEPGGVVNYITKQPLSDPFYSGEFTVGSYDFFRPSLDISGPLTADKNLLYRLNVAYDNFGSFIDFVDGEVFFASPILTYKVSDATTLTLEYEYVDLDQYFYDGLPPDPISFELPISRNLGEPGNRIRFNSNKVTTTLEHRFGENLQLRSAFSAQLDERPFSAVRPEELEPDGRTVQRIFRTLDDYRQAYSLQTDLIGKFNIGPVKHQLLLGLELSRFNRDLTLKEAAFPSLDIFNPVYGAPLPTRFDEDFQQKQSTNTVGIYLQDQVVLLPNLKLLVGGRFDFVSFNDEFTDNISGGDPEEISDSAEAFSPRVGIVYQPIEPISLYASYSQAFVPSFGFLTVSGEPLQPQRGTQYEVGVKGEFLDGRLSTTLAAYEITKTNVPTVDPDDLDFSIAAGELKSRGIELDVAGEIAPGWNVIASFFLNDAFVSEDNDLPVGDTLVNAPGQGGSLWTTYEIQTGDLQGLGFGAGLFFVGDREATLPNTITIPSYVRADATIFYRRNNYRTHLRS